MPITQSINDVDIIESANAAHDIYLYSMEKPGNFTYWRTIELFRYPPGELAAALTASSDSRTAYVAIRGTSLIGNWLFTNFQAHFAPFYVVDETLSDATVTKYQGGGYRTPVYGTLHQGFFRAFSWLWYGTEPMLDRTERSSEVGFARLQRYFFLFILFPAMSWTVAWIMNAPTWIGLVILSSTLLITFLFVTSEAGVWEDIFKSDPKDYGKQPFTLLEILNHYERVVFTGHSLGGAVATIAFAVYRCWCKSDPSRKDNSYLVSFGAPRVGDEIFMKAFCLSHQGRFVHVVHPGDPVPELPPNGLYELYCRKIWRRGPIGFIVLMVFPFWAFISKLYRAKRAARWDKSVMREVDDPSTNKLSFSYHSMSDVYHRWATKLKREEAG